MAKLRLRNQYKAKLRKNVAADIIFPLQRLLYCSKRGQKVKDFVLNKIAKPDISALRKMRIYGTRRYLPNQISL